MPYTYEDKSAGSPFFLERLQVPTGDVLEEQFAQAFEENPIMAVKRWYELREDQKTGRRLTKTEADERIAQSSLAGHLSIDDNGITENALRTLMFRKQVELRRAEIFSRARGGFAEGAARLGVALATTAVDPINVGLGFVPIFGQARYAKWLSNARGFAARAGVRAAVGAAEGAAGAAIVEPLIYGSRRAEQADYDTIDSLMNVAFGSVFGAALHTSVGGLAEAARKLGFRKGKAVEVDLEPVIPREDAPAPKQPQLEVVDLSTLTRADLDREIDRLSIRKEELDAKGRDNLTRKEQIETDALSHMIEVLVTTAETPEIAGYVTLGARNEAGQLVAAGNGAVTDGEFIGQSLGSIHAGAGRRIMRAMKELMAEQGITRAQIFSSDVARRLYERAGFTPLDAQEAARAFPMMEATIPAKARHVERTREVVGQAVKGEPINGGVNPRTRDPDWVDGVVQPDPEVRESVVQSEATIKEVPEQPEEMIDEQLSTSEAELKETEQRLGIEKEEVLDPDVADVEEASQKADRWARAAEIATTCLTRGS
jgi:hypothetical protein